MDYYVKAGPIEYGNVLPVMMGASNFMDVYRFTRDAILPSRNLSTDAGLDIFSNEDVFIPTGVTKLVKTGVAIKVNDGYVGKIEDRSSMGVSGLRVGAGIIDAGFSGEVSVVLHNLTCDSDVDPVLFRKGKQIKKGDKIAQMLVIQVDCPSVNEVNVLWDSERGDKGFGSSGR